VNPFDRQSADSIDQVSKALVEWTLAAMAEEDPSFATRNGPEAMRLWRGELKNRIQHLAEAVACGSPEILARNVCWSREAFEARDLPVTDLDASVRCLRSVIDEQLPASIATRCSVAIDAGLARLAEAKPCRSDRAVSENPEPIAGEDEDATAARLYLLHLFERQEEEAARVVLDMQERGRGTTEIYERVLAPALAEIGRMWHLREATIADEHFATGATRMIMAELRRNAPREPRIGRSCLCTAVGGDLHDLGIRMVADVFEFAGWDSECLGADMPAEEIVSALESRVTGRFDLLAVAANTMLGLRPTADLIDIVRGSSVGKGVRVLVGGLPFRIAPELAKVVGADGCAHSASAAVELADRLLASQPTPSHG
jgi:MerR family transcriptional regulator, light-induced transcriptional regulator